MDIGIRDVARLLKVPEQTVYKWARSGELPAQRVHDQYRFNRVELQEWATARKMDISPELFAPNGVVSAMPSLHAALERGGVHHGLAGQRREQVLEALTRLPAIPKTVDRTLLYELLVAREALASTGVGDGIALPHPRDPLVVQIDEPLVLLCFLGNAIEFGAIDGRPVRVLFALLSPSVRQHLQMLSKLSHALHDRVLQDLLRVTAPSEAILERVRQVDEC